MVMKRIQHLGMAGAAGIAGFVIGAIFTYVSLYFGGSSQALEMLFGVSVVGQMTNLEYAIGTGLLTGMVSGVLGSLAFGGLLSAPPQEGDVDIKPLLFGAGCGFCLPIGPLTGYLITHPIAGMISTVAGLAVGGVGGIVYVIYKHNQNPFSADAAATSTEHAQHAALPEPDQAAWPLAAHTPGANNPASSWPEAYDNPNVGEPKAYEPDDNPWHDDQKITNNSVPLGNSSAALLPDLPPTQAGPAVAEEPLRETMPLPSIEEPASPAAPAAEPLHARIVVFIDGHKDQEFILTEEVTRVGRDPLLDHLVLPGVDDRIVIQKTLAGFQIQGGEPGVAARLLKHDDIITLGSITLKFVYDAEPAGETAPFTADALVQTMIAAQQRRKKS